MSAYHLSTPTERDSRWSRVIARDRTADGKFYYSVVTTGVYCLPSCASRQANPKNVDFHQTIAECVAAGFRPCRRCKPDQPPLATRNGGKIAFVCRLIARSEEPLTLAEMAEAARLSPYHFHRIFKAVTGMTPKKYTAANQASKVRDELTRSETVTQALYDAGFNSNGRFYEKSREMLGMNPSDYRDGGLDVDITFAVGECSLGSILVARSDKGVCAISLGDDPQALVHDLQDRFSKAHVIGGDAAFEAFVAQVVGLVEAPGVGLDLPLDVRGTAFQQRVWQALREIPAGTTVTYTDIANRIGAPTSVRAVASACGANTLAVAIPCHRVIGRNGSLSGYRWGVERKRDLLAREALQSAESILNG